MKSVKWIVFAVALGLMAGSAAILYQLKNRPHLTAPGVKVGPVPIYGEGGKLAAQTSVLLPTNLVGYPSQPQPISKVELTDLPKDTTFGRRSYSLPDNIQALVTVVLMGTDRTSIHQPQFCLTGQGWSLEPQENITLRMDRPFPYDLPAVKLTAANSINDQKGKSVPVRGIYIYWFVAEDKVTAGQGTRMGSMITTLLQKGLLERWAYVSYFAACYPGHEEATYKQLQEFIRQSLPEFQLATGAKIP